MKQVYAKDLKPGQSISNIPFVIIKKESKIAKNGKEYLDLVLGDKSGTLVTKIWGEKYEACSVDALKEGVVVLVSGSTTEFNGKLQLTMNMAIIQSTYDEEDFVPVGKRDVNEIIVYLNNKIDQIGDRHIKKLLKNIFADTAFLQVIKRTPAAMKHHHAFVGGLLEHIQEMIEFAEPMARLYQPNNWDLVLAGIILHDIGKTEEIIWNNMTIDYSEKGKLLGHVHIGLDIINRYKDADFDQECLQLLQHIIISHHGKIEFGAVVIPATIEAKIVSLADEASAKLRGYLTSYEDGLSNGTLFSEYNKTLETMVYLKNYTSQLNDDSTVVHL